MSTELVGTVAAHEHRHLMTHFPTGVSVVTAVDGAGLPHGVTCSSLTSVCLEPPTLLVSLSTRSRVLQHARVRGSFGITLLNAESREIAQRFAAPAVDRFTGLAWTPSPLGTPWLESAMTACADCTVLRTTEVGDHTLLLGVVCNIRVAGGSPLLYGLRNYRSWQ